MLTDCELSDLGISWELLSLFRHDASESLLVLLLLTAAVWLWLKDAGEKQAQLDRVLREKHSVEAELEKVYHEGIVESGRESRDVTELSQRACTAERQRDEAKMKADSLACQLRRVETMYVLPVCLVFNATGWHRNKPRPSHVIVRPPCMYCV